MRSNSHTWFFLFLVIGLPFSAYAVYTWYENNFQKLPVYGKVRVADGESQAHRIDDFEFTNQEGKPKGTKDWYHKIIIADFFFTHCPSICPKMTNSLKQVQGAFDNDREILINSFTIDPERDSISRLLWYSKKFDINISNWDLLTGDKKEIYRLARNSFMIVATGGDGGPDDFIHSENLVLVDKMRRIRGYYDGTSELNVKQLIKDINKLKHEN